MSGRLGTHGRVLLLMSRPMPQKEEETRALGMLQILMHGMATKNGGLEAMINGGGPTIRLIKAGKQAVDRNGQAGKVDKRKAKGADQAARAEARVLERKKA